MPFWLCLFLFLLSSLFKKPAGLEDAVRKERRALE